MINKYQSVFDLLLSEGFIGDRLVLFVSIGADKLHIENIVKRAKSIGYNVEVFFYENFTNAKGINCIKEAILSYTNHASFCMPRLFLGARGKKGEIQAFSVRDNCLMKYDFSTNRWKHC